MAEHHHTDSTCPETHNVHSTKDGGNGRTILQPKKHRKENLLLQSFLKHMQDEYWAYIALLGLVFTYTGIMVTVFGFTDIMSPTDGPAIGGLGVFLILVGMALIITSGILYHRKVRRLRPCICYGVDMDDGPDVIIRTKRRLRFAPNLISPYYQAAREDEAAREQQAARAKKRDSVDERKQNVVLETEDYVAGSNDGSDISLITNEKAGATTTKC